MKKKCLFISLMLYCVLLLISIFILVTFSLYVRANSIEMQYAETIMPNNYDEVKGTLLKNLWVDIIVIIYSVTISVFCVIKSINLIKINKHFNQKQGDRNNSSR